MDDDIYDLPVGEDHDDPENYGADPGDYGADLGDYGSDLGDYGADLGGDVNHQDLNQGRRPHPDYDPILDSGPQAASDPASDPFPDSQPPLSSQGDRRPHAPLDALEALGAPEAPEAPEALEPRDARDFDARGIGGYSQLDPPPPVMTQEDLEMRGRLEAHITHLHGLLKRAVPDNIDELPEYQLRKMKAKAEYLVEMEESIRLYRRYLMFFVVIIEKMHAVYNPAYANALAGWSESILVQLPSYDPYLIRVYEYYSGGKKWHPLVALANAVATNGAMYALVRLLTVYGSTFIQQAMVNSAGGGDPNIGSNIMSAFGQMTGVPQGQSAGNNGMNMSAQSASKINDAVQGPISFGGAATSNGAGGAGGPGGLKNLMPLDPSSPLNAFLPVIQQVAGPLFGAASANANNPMSRSHPMDPTRPLHEPSNPGPGGPPMSTATGTQNPFSAIGTFLGNIFNPSGPNASIPGMPGTQTTPQQAAPQPPHTRGPIPLNTGRPQAAPSRPPHIDVEQVLQQSRAMAQHAAAAAAQQAQVEPGLPPSRMTPNRMSSEMSPQQAQHVPSDISSLLRRADQVNNTPNGMDGLGGLEGHTGTRTVNLN